MLKPVKSIFLFICLSATLLLINGGCISAKDTSFNKQVSNAYVTTDEAKLFCRVIGKGKPLIVVNGGTGLTQDYLLPAMYALAENNTVIFYDQRACGRSTGEINANTITVEQFVKDLDAIRKAFNIDKVSILGHSFGGFIAMSYAIAHPDQVENLILMSSLPASSEESSLFFQELGARMAPFQTELDEVLASQGYQSGNPKDVEHAIKLYFRTYCYDSKNADLLDLTMSPKAAQNYLEISGLFWVNFFSQPFDIHDSLHNLQTRTLVIHGDFDPIPSFTAENLHKNIKNSQFILMKDCGHFPFVEKPIELFQHIQEFLGVE